MDLASTLGFFMVVLSLVVFLDADLGLFSLFLGVFPNFQLTVLKTIWADGSLTAAMVRRRKNSPILS